MTGAARWDLVLNEINQYALGVGYVDDCFVLGVNYVTSYQYATTTSPPILDHTFLLQLGREPLLIDHAVAVEQGQHPSRRMNCQRVADPTRVG